MNPNREYRQGPALAGPVRQAALFYLLWGMVSFGVFLSGRLLTAGPVAELIFISAGLFGTVLATRAYTVFVEPEILGNTRCRLAWLLSLACIFSIICIVVKVTETRSNIFMALSTATLILFASVLGHWLARPLKRSAELVPICLVVSMSDIFSVFSGPTKQFAGTISQYYTQGMEGPAPLVDFFLVKFPLPGHDLFMPIFGITDWIVIVLLSAGAARFELNDNILPTAGRRFGRYLFFPAAGLGLALAVAAARTLNRFLPALPFVAIVFLAVMAIKYPQVRRLTRSEIRPTALVLLFMAGLTAVLKMI